MQAYQYPTWVGLVLFGDKVEKACEITPLFETFRKHIDEIYCEGDTNLYCSLETAADMLVAFRQKNPKVTKRTSLHLHWPLQKKR